MEYLLLLFRFQFVCQIPYTNAGASIARPGSESMIKSHPYIDVQHLPDKPRLWLSAFVSTYNGKTKNAFVILSEQSESKDPGTDFTVNRDQMRRFLDSVSASLGMADPCFVRFTVLADENR